MNKKGFTLIELLAVIVILAIILLIAMPIVLNVIEESRRGAFNSTGHGLVKAAENEYMRAALDGDLTEGLEFEWENGNLTLASDGLEYSGKGPTSGNIVVLNDGRSAMAITDGTYCSVKVLDSTDVDTYNSDTWPTTGVFASKTLADDCRVMTAHDDANGLNLLGLTAP